MLELQIRLLQPLRERRRDFIDGLERAGRALQGGISEVEGLTESRLLSNAELDEIREGEKEEGERRKGSKGKCKEK